MESSEECSPLLRLQWLLYEIRATAREVPSFSTAYTVFSLPNTGCHPEYLLFWYGLCNLKSFEYGYNHLTVDPCVISLPDGRYLYMECFFCHALSMQLLVPGRYLDEQPHRSNGCASPALSMQLPVSWSLTYQMVWNYPKDAFLLH